MKLNILILLLILTVFFICPANAEIVNINTSEDSYINALNASTNYGDLTYLYTYYHNNADSSYSLIKFDVTEYVGEAYLYVYCTDGWGFPHTISIYRTQNDWDEETITWNDQPNLFSTTTVASENVIGTNTWVRFNVSSSVQEPTNYSFRIKEKYGYSGKWASKEYKNGTYAAYLQIHTIECPTDINWNNYTNSDSKAFTVNTSDVIRFNITAPDAANISNYEWYVNKVNQPNDNSYFDFTVPSFDVNQPSTGIWEIRVEGKYINNSTLVREWLISGLTEEQAPDFMDYFVDRDNVGRSGYLKDPWGRDWPYYTSPIDNLISEGYLTETDTGSNRVLKTTFNINYGTFKFKINANSAYDIMQFLVYDEDMASKWNVQWTANEYHDYFAIVNNSIGYIPISRRHLGQAPGVRYWNTNDWKEITVIRTEDDWWSIWEDGAMLPAAYLHVDNAMSEAAYLYLAANDGIQLDCVEVYEDQYLYPGTCIRYSSAYPKWWIPGTVTKINHDPVYAPGIVVFGRNLTLKQISDSINNENLMTYDESTSTAVIKTNLFLESGSELNINNEKLIFDTTEESLFFRPDAGVMLRIENSTISTTCENPMIWNFASTVAQTVLDPDKAANDTSILSNSRSQPYTDYRGHLIIENSIIDNTCNLFMDGPHELIIKDTTFYNHSSMSYSSEAWITSQDLYNQKQIQSAGAKGIWLALRNDLAKYGISNISFVNPKPSMDLKVVGGEWIFNDTTIQDSDLSNINITTKKAYKYSSFQFYRDIYENSSFALLNCIVDENKLTVSTDRAKIKTKYYADIVVKNGTCDPFQDASITFNASNEKYNAESLYQYDRYEGVGPGEDGVTGYGEDSPQYTTYTGGHFKKWDNALPLGSAITDEYGRTSLPSENLKNSIVLTDYVLTNETGTQSKESIVYNLTISLPNSKSFNIQEVDPDPTWYRKKTSLSEYTITAIIPDDSTGPHITGFAPSEENPFNPGDEKIFRVWTDENLTSMEWYVDGSPVSKGLLSYTWTVTEGNHAIEFRGSNANGTISQSWNVGEYASALPAPIIEFFPADTALTRNIGEPVTFSVKSDQPLTMNWFINGEQVRDYSTSITRSWDAPDTYNITVDGVSGEETILHTWMVDVVEPVKSLDASNVTLSPEYQIVTPNQPFAVDVWIEPGTAINGAQFDLLFDSSLVRVDSVTEGNFLNQDGDRTYFSSGTINNSIGTVTKVFGSILASNVSSPGVFATIAMTAGSNTGVAELNLSNVIVSDSDLKAAPITISNATVLVDTAPFLNSIGSRSVSETNLLNFAVDARDADGDELTYSATCLPDGANFDPASGVFTWTPARGQAGVYIATFGVSDGYLSDSEDVSITVSPANNIPVIDSFEPENGSSFNEKEKINISVSASDPDGQSLSYIIKIDGITFSTEPSYIWKPDFSSSGEHTVEVTVSDGIDQVTEQHIIYVKDYHPSWDVNEDDEVNILDIANVSQRFGTTTTEPYPRWDVTDYGQVDILDLSLVGFHFGEKMV